MKKKGMGTIKRNQTKLIKLTVTIIALSALVMNVTKLAKECKVLYAGKADDSIHYEEKLKPVKTVLPKDSQVGFMTDEKDLAKAQASLFLTQYVLSPNQVIFQESKEYTIGLFGSVPAKLHFMKSNNFRSVREIDEQLALYKEEKQE